MSFLFLHLWLCEPKNWTTKNWSWGTECGKESLDGSLFHRASRCRKTAKVTQLFRNNLNIFRVDNIGIKSYQYILHVAQPHHNHLLNFLYQNVTRHSQHESTKSQWTPPDPNHLLPNELTTVLLQRDALAAVPSASPSDACGSKTWGDHRTRHATEMDGRCWKSYFGAMDRETFCNNLPMPR